MKWCLVFLPALLSAQVELGPAPRLQPPPSTKTEERAATVERGVGYDTSNRETVRQAYLNTFTSVSMGWTGAIAGCVPGTTSSAWRDSAAARINWFRAMAGVPASITLNDTYNTKDQQGALMMSANRALSHAPPSGWTCYTSQGFEAADNSNLCLNWNTTPEPGCVSQYIQDSGSNNYFVGHRRWILHPQTQQMGTGDVAQTGAYPGSGYPYANAMWVFDGNTFAPRPATRDGFVAWPPKGYVPYQKVYARWSFAYPGANFSNATVTMNGSSSGVTIETLVNDQGYGENTIVWTWSGQPTGVPSSDTTVTVTISGITGAPQSFYTYDVIIFDPATTGGGGGTTAVTVTTNPAGRTFTVDGATYSSTQIFNWTPGSQHTIATTSPQTSSGTRYNFANWSDSGAISHTITTPASSTTYTANFTTQYLLTTTVSPPGAGTITPNPTSGDGYYNAGASVQLTASSTNFANWSGDLTGTTNPQNLTMNGPRSVTANFNTGTSITVTTNPAGRTFTVDGATYSSTQVFNWTPGSQHTIATTTPQTSAGTRYNFASWSDAGAISHTITTPASPTTYTATFSTQYLLTTNVSPNGAGTVTPNPTSGDGYYNPGTSVQLTASATNFANWSGDLTGTANPQNVIMNGPRTVTANYTSTNAITITTNPVGRTIMVDGATYTAPQVFNWTQGSQHTIATTSPQTVAGTRYTFANWSDAGAISHTITAPANSTTYTANFNTQYLLTTLVSPNGAGSITRNPTSGDGYYSAGTSVQLTASAPQFLNWSGDLTGTTNPLNFFMNGPRTVTANYSTSGTSCTYGVPQSTYNVPATSYTGGIPVTANCAFVPTTQSTWIQILSSPSETPLRYTTERNTGPARAGSITIGTTTTTIVQDAAPAMSNALRFVSLAPCRLMETRPEYNFEGRTGAFGPPYMQANESRTLIPSQSNVCTIPADAKAYVFNVTLVPRGPVDHITVWPAGQSRPNFWTLRSPDSQIVANAAIVAAGTSGGIQVFASHDADLIIDIAGYFTDSPAASNLVFYPLNPCRVIDTRIDYRQPAGPFGPPSMTAQTKRTFQFPAAGAYCTIPATARAFSVSLTAVPKGPLQFMTIWPAGASQPNVSSINSPSGRILANSVIVPASANGSIDVYAYNDTDFLIDINGYFAPDDGQTGLYFFTAPQCRISDAAYGSEATTTIGIAASNQCLNIPSTAKAFALNFTSISNGAPMPFLTAYPTGQAQPNASVLNAFEGQTVTNSAIIPSGPNGQVNVFAYRPTQVVVELSGYFNR